MTIEINSKVFTPVSTGRYVQSTNALGQPGSSLSIKGASKTRNKQLNFACARTIEKDVANLDGTVRRISANVQLIANMPSFGITESDIRSLVADLNDLLNDPASGDYLYSILLGSSDPTLGVAV